jgi:hypothetical protein
MEEKEIVTNGVLGIALGSQRAEIGLFVTFSMSSVTVASLSPGIFGGMARVLNRDCTHRICVAAVNRQTGSHGGLRNPT